MKIALLLLAASASLPAQSPAFDVASIKPDLSGSHNTSISTSHGRFTATNVNLQLLIQSAYGIKDFQITNAPGWIRDDRYDVMAKTDSSVESDEDFQPRIQALLAERFGLKFHREKKEFPVYSMVVAKSGSKLPAHTGGGESNTGVHSNSGTISITASKATTARIADILGRSVDRIVIDNTGLKGEFDFKLDWVSELTPDSSGPSLFTALQEQLGLRLEAQKGPVEVLVIDSVGKPSEN